VDPATLGAVAVDRLAVCSSRRRTQTPLPFTALSLSRRVLDEALLVRAAAVGVQVRRGARVTGLERDGPGWSARTEGGETLAAAEVFLATGKHDLRGWKRPPGSQSDLIGFKLHLRLAAPIERTVELHLFDGGYAGLEPVEGGRANLCLVVRKSAFAGWDGLWARLPPQLARRLEGAVAETSRPLAIAAIPYGYVRRRSDGPWRLGDQAAVIPSFAGEGMSIALHSAELAADVFLAGGGADLFQVAGATAVSQLLVRPWAQALIGPGLAAAPGLARLVARRTRLPAGAQQARPRPSRRDAATTPGPAPPPAR
jgi:flavin-dependent dehydrogenase